MFGSAGRGENVDEPPDAEAVAGQNLQNAQRDVVQKEAFPPQQDGDYENQRRVGVIDRRERDDLVVAHPFELFFDRYERCGFEFIRVACEKHVDPISFHDCTLGRFRTVVVQRYE